MHLLIKELHSESSILWGFQVFYFVIMNPHLSFKLLFLFCCQWTAVKQREKRGEARFIFKLYVRIKCQILKILCWKRKWIITDTDIMTRDNIKTMYTFIYTQIHVFNVFFHHVHTRGRIWKYYCFSVVHIPSAVSYFTVNFKSIRWAKRYSVSESLFFTGTRLSQWRYGNSCNCLSPQLCCLDESRKSTSLFHINTQFYLLYFPSPTSFLPFPFPPFLAVCVGGLSFFVW